MATATTPDGIDQFELARDINDAYRRARLNMIYYGRQLYWSQRWAIGVDCLIAVGTSATVASLGAMNTPTGRSVLMVLAVVAALLAVLKPVLALPDRIGRQAKLWSAYSGAFHALDRVTSDVRLHDEIRPEFRAAAVAAVEGCTSLSAFEDVNPSRKVIRWARAATEREIPADRLWWPAGSTFPAAASSVPASAAR